MPSLENTLGQGIPRAPAGARALPLAAARGAAIRRTQAGAGEMELPEPKEAVIDRLRAALEQRGTGTGGWWRRQLDLCLIGVMATFGCEKALGDEGGLAWWEAAAAAARQHIPIPRWPMTAGH